MDYSEKCYEKTALSQVLIRLDILEFIDSNSLFSDAIEKNILPFFPIKGKQQLISFNTVNVTVDSQSKQTHSENRSLEGIQRVYNDAFENKLVVSNKYIIVECNHYTSYEDLNKSFTPFLKTLLINNNITVTRTGVRYINIFNDDSIKPQKRYYNAPVSALMDSKLYNDGKCIRSLNLTEYSVGDMRINFRYGLFNPYYPQSIKRPHFVLDYDCFCISAIQGYENIMEHINFGHDEIQNLFESSISDSLKKVMGNGRISEK